MLKQEEQRYGTNEGFVTSKESKKNSEKAESNRDVDIDINRYCLTIDLGVDIARCRMIVDTQ